MKKLLDQSQRLLRLSRTVPASLQELQARCQSLETSLAGLTELTRRVQHQTQTELDPVQKLSSTRLQALQQDRQRLDQLCQEYTRVVEELQLQQTRFSHQLLTEQPRLEQEAEGFQQELALTAQEVQRACQHFHSQLETGLERAQSAWNLLEGSLQEALNCVRGAQTQTQEAWDAEQSQMQQFQHTVANQQQSLRDQLERFLEQGRQDQRRLQTSLAETLAGPISANATAIETSTTQRLEVGVEKSSRQHIERYLQEGVLVMADRSRRSQELFDPPLHELEKSVKRYAGATRLKPMLVALYYFLQGIHQEGLMAPYYSLLFGESENV